MRTVYGSLREGVGLIPLDRLQFLTLPPLTQIPEGALRKSHVTVHLSSVYFNECRTEGVCPKDCCLGSVAYTINAVSLRSRQFLRSLRLVSQSMRVLVYTRHILTLCGVLGRRNQICWQSSVSTWAGTLGGQSMLPCLFKDLENRVSHADHVHFQCLAWSPHPAYNDLVAAASTAGRLQLIRFGSSASSGQDGPNSLATPPVFNIVPRIVRPCNAVSFLDVVSKAQLSVLNPSNQGRILTPRATSPCRGRRQRKRGRRAQYLGY